jgi:response regulator RpfG family c-di-GMP phosphodiesterase
MASAFENLSLYQQLRSANEATVMALADLAELRDESTGDHLVRVRRLTNAVVARLHEQGKFPDELRAMIGTASILHDVGKVATPDHILLKPARLTDEERVIMKEHARNGEEILERAACLTTSENYLSIGAQIAGGHHECFDGSGYPRGLKGDDIPLSARIVAIVDVFDALVHKRLYKDAWEVEAALDYLRSGSGKQFDPEVLEAFLSVVEVNQSAWEDSGDAEVI